MTVVAFSMSGEPRGKGRPRATVRKVGQKTVATVYTDDATRKYEASVRAVAQKAMAGRDPLEGPLSLSLRFRMPIPKSATKRAKAGMASGEIAHCSRPDLDNCQKALMDAMNGVVFCDDGQVVRAFTTKLYAEQPGVDVRVEAFAPQGAGQ
jgi:Holliday junction resolvase RusA-like endonuclease